MSSRARRRKWSKERPPNLSDLRIVLLGKSVSENSLVGNFILGRAAFDSEAPPDVVERVGGRLKDRHLMIINSPQLLQTNISDHQITHTVRECVFLSDPGPHVFIIILQYKDFTEEDLRRVKYMLDRFSEEAIKRSVVITTDEETKANEFIQRLTAECGGGHLQLDRENEECCSIILQRLEQILRENSEEFLTCELYHDAQETLVDEDQSRSSSLRTDEEDSDGAASGTRQQKLNLVLCGSDETLKNSISNLIKQKRRDVELHAHLMNLVELPALTRLSEEEVMRQTLSCVSLCDPGVHIFLFIVPDAPLNNEDKAEMEEIQRIFSSRINKHIMILIKQDSEHQTEELSEETQSVIESFGGRHHFFGPKTQVSTLMKNIEQMLEENRGGFFSTETFLEAQMKKLMKYEEMKRKINSLETHLLSQVSRENTDNEVRIVLLGKTGVGKSATGNTILGRDAFTAETSQESVTKESQRESSEINGRRVTVIDTPGLFDTELSNEEIQREIRHCISMILPGPHVFIIVLNLGQQFTQEAATSVTLIQETFGEKSLMYTMVLFTRGDDLKDKTIDEFLGKPGSPLMKLIKACGNRYHVFNNIPTEDRTQVTDLLQKIDNMLKENGGSFYSCKMFREMEREKQEQQMKILMERLREREEEMKKERETFKHETEQLKQENKKVKTEKEKLQIKYNTETERLMNRIENERKKREEELNEREERYKTLMKEKEESEEKMCEEIKREREEWEKQKLEEKMRREEEDERRREEEQYKTLMKVREEKKRKMFEQMKLEPMQWGKWKQYEVQKREQEKIEQEKQKFELYKQQQSPLRDYGMMQIRQSVPVNIQDTPVSRLPFRRIVLLGKTGVGKSAAGNTILGRKEFRSEISWTAVTSECSAAHTVSGRSVTVVDTPGFFHTHMKHEESMTEIERSVYLSSPGPHAFLIVFPVNLWFTEHEQQILQQIPQQIEMLFGQEVLKYSIILFTHGDLLEGNSIHTLIEKISPLRHLVDQCGGRYHVFNNRDQSNREQVTGLLEKIDTMIEQNGGGYYRNQMFQDAQRFRRGEKQSQGCVCS